MTPKSTTGAPPSLVERRKRLRLEDTRARLNASLDAVRGGLSRLHDSGLLFTRHGTRVAKDLLDAQVHLLKASGLVDAAEATEVPGPARLESVLEAVDVALDRAAGHARRHRLHVAPDSDHG